MTSSAQFKQIRVPVVPATRRQRLAALFLKSLPVKHYTSDKQDVDKSLDPKKSSVCQLTTNCCYLFQETIFIWSKLAQRIALPYLRIRTVSTDSMDSESKLSSVLAECLIKPLL